MPRCWIEMGPAESSREGKEPMETPRELSHTLNLGRTTHHPVGASRGPCPIPSQLGQRGCTEAHWGLRWGAPLEAGTL